MKTEKAEICEIPLFRSVPTCADGRRSDELSGKGGVHVGRGGGSSSSSAVLKDAAVEAVLIVAERVLKDVDGKVSASSKSAWMDSIVGEDGRGRLDERRGR